MKSDSHPRNQHNKPMFYTWFDHGKNTPNDQPRWVMHGKTMTAFIMGTLKNWTWYVVDHRGEQAKGTHQNIRYCKWVVKEKLLELEEKYAHERTTDH